MWEINRNYGRYTQQMIFGDVSNLGKKTTSLCSVSNAGSCARSGSDWTSAEPPGACSIHPLPHVPHHKPLVATKKDIPQKMNQPPLLKSHLENARRIHNLTTQSPKSPKSSYQSPRPDAPVSCFHLILAVLHHQCHRRAARLTDPLCRQRCLGPLRPQPSLIDAKPGFHRRTDLTWVLPWEPSLQLT